VSGSPRVPFPFAPHPRRIYEARRAGAIDADEYLLLKVLCDCADPTTFVDVEITLATLADRMGWRHSLDWLYRKLAGLRGRFVEYEKRPGKKDLVYRIRLIQPSEQGPSTSEADCPSRVDAGIGSTSGIPWAVASGKSEHKSERDGLPDPSDTTDRPSTRASAIPLRVREAPRAPASRVRAHLDLPREENPHRRNDDHLLSGPRGGASEDKKATRRSALEETNALLSALGRTRAASERRRTRVSFADLPNREREFMREFVETFDATRVVEEAT